MKDEETARVIRQLENSTDSGSGSEEDEFEQPPSTTATAPSQAPPLQLIFHDFSPHIDSIIFVQSSKFAWFRVLVNTNNR